MTCYPSINNSLQRVRQYLFDQTNNGGFPYYRGHSASTEPTAWCSIALRHHKQFAESAVAYLSATQNKDGGWSTAKGIGESDWTSSLAVLAIGKLSTQPLSNQTLLSGVEYLINHRSASYSPLASLFAYVMQGTKMHVGWSWTPGSYYWAEPTSYAIYAIQPAKAADLYGAKEAIISGTKALISKACPGGGWNYGNNIVLGNVVPPFAVTTAQVLLALQSCQDEPAVKSALSYLRQNALSQTTVMSLSWVIMALDAFAVDVSALLQILTAKQNPDGSFGPNLLSSALAACALGTALSDNPLKLAP